MTAVRVTAPYVTLTVAGNNGPELRGFYRDATADAIDAEQVERLGRKGMLEVIAAPEPKAEEPKAPAKSTKASAAD